MKGLRHKFLMAQESQAEYLTPEVMPEGFEVHEISAMITEICSEPVNFEGVLQKIFARLNLSMTFEQHALVGSTVRSYLAWL